MIYALYLITIYTLYTFINLKMFVSKILFLQTSNFRCTLKKVLTFIVLVSFGCGVTSLLSSFGCDMHVVLRK